MMTGLEMKDKTKRKEEWKKWGEMMKRITNERGGEATEGRDRRLESFFSFFFKDENITEGEEERDKEGQRRRGRME